MRVFIYVKKFFKRHIVLLLYCIYIVVLIPGMCSFLYTLYRKALLCDNNIKEDSLILYGRVNQMFWSMHFINFHLINAQ